MSRSIISRGALRQVDCRLVQLTCPNATLRVLAGGHSCGGEAAIHPRLKGSSSSSSNIGRYCPSAELSCGCRSRLTGTGGKRQCETWIFWVCCTNHTRRFLIGEWLFISNFLLTTFSSSLSLPLTSSEHTPRGPTCPSPSSQQLDQNSSDLFTAGTTAATVPVHMQLEVALT